MPQVNLRQDVYDRGRDLLTYGKSWSDLIDWLITDNADLANRVIELEKKIDKKESKRVKR